jgi:hypothetical protein
MVDIQVWDFTGVEIWPGAVMDYPTAWKFVKTTKMGDHHPKCSYRQMDGGLLCDCDIIKDENRRIASKVVRNSSSENEQGVENGSASER